MSQPSTPKKEPKVSKQSTEKKVADKAPIDSISIKTIGESNPKPKKNKKKNKKITKNFNYIIIIADFYYKKTAYSMIERIKNETPNNDGKIKKLSKNLYRVYLGPYRDFNSLQKSFNDIKVLQFENNVRLDLPLSNHA